MKLRNYSTKLSKEIIDKMVLFNVSSYEIDFILYLAFRQNSFGIVDEVIYSDVMDIIGMSKQSFYNVKKRLELNGFIESEQGMDGFWRIKIVDNNFQSKDEDKKGYININKAILKNDNFFGLKAKEKILLLKLLNNKPLKENKPFQIFVETIKKWVNVKSSYCIYKYLDNVKKYFNINLVSHNDMQTKIVFLPNKRAFLRTYNTEKEAYFIHKIKMICCKNKVHTYDEALNDIATLINQYSIGKVIEALKKSFSTSNILQPKLINFIINNS